MDELGKVKRVIEKQAEVDEVLLVLDATTGQNGLNQAKVFGEDLQMLERQQANISKWPDRKLLMLNIDAGGMQSRRVIDRVLAAEQAAAADRLAGASAAELSQ